jgi:hypothetical protein
MMATTRPRLRLAVLCAYVTPDADGLPFALNCPLHTLRLPADSAERSRPRTFSLYTQLQDAWNTTCAFQLQVRNERDQIVYTGPEQSVAFSEFTYRVVPLEQEFKIAFVFPEPGVYSVYVLCDGRSMHDSPSPDDRPFPPPQLNVLG